MAYVLSDFLGLGDALWKHRFILVAAISVRSFPADDFHFRGAGTDRRKKGGEVVSYDRPIHGLMAQFEDHELLIDAARRAYAEGYRRMDAYTPFPVEGLAEALVRRGTIIPFVVLVGGVLGALGGYFMQDYAMALDYPLNIGGRPLHSWPQFIPITFELTVLTASLFALVGMLVLNKLPEPYHPVFNAPGFDRASQDRFFLCVEAADPKFDLEKTKEFLRTLEPSEVLEVKQ